MIDDHRIFRLATAINASRAELIQKRTTILISCSPVKKKWLWSGRSGDQAVAGHFEPADLGEHAERLDDEHATDQDAQNLLPAARADRRVDVTTGGASRVDRCGCSRWSGTIFCMTRSRGPVADCSRP